MVLLLYLASAGVPLAAFKKAYYMLAAECSSTGFFSDILASLSFFIAWCLESAWMSSYRVTGF